MESQYGDIFPSANSKFSMKFPDESRKKMMMFIDSFLHHFSSQLIYHVINEIYNVMLSMMWALDNQ